MDCNASCYYCIFFNNLQVARGRFVTSFQGILNFTQMAKNWDFKTELYFYDLGWNMQLAIALFGRA